MTLTNFSIDRKRDQMQRRAAKRGLKCWLPRWYMKRLMKITHCQLSGEEFVDSSNNDECRSFDRIDPTKGYVVGNLAVIKGKFNHIRDDDMFAMESASRLADLEADREEATKNIECAQSKIDKYKSELTDLKKQQKQLSNKINSITQLKNNEHNRLNKNKHHLEFLAKKISNLKIVVDNIGSIIEQSWVKRWFPKDGL